MTKPLGDAAQALAHALYSNLALADVFFDPADQIGVGLNGNDSGRGDVTRAF